jgi:hypothetical protein
LSASLKAVKYSHFMSKNDEIPKWVKIIEELKKKAEEES